MQCSRCQGDNPEDARFCMQCGESLQLTCGGCGAELGPGARFCSQCGEATAPSDPPVLVAEVPAALGGGRFRLERLVGEGSKKRVYLARDTRLDREVAVAVLKTDGLDADARLRVRREAQAMARLGDHPNVVTVFDVEEDGDELFIVSAFMAGGGLDNAIRSSAGRGLPVVDVLRWAGEVCQALAFAHQQGVVHRDVKPGNVWLGDDGRARLGDFGLAVSAGDTKLTQAGTVLGTADYMPPEQAMGGDATPSSDLYSLGAMLYEMLTGKPPFQGDDAVAVIGQHVNSQPVAPRFVNSGIPVELEGLVLSLLSKDPFDRPADAETVGLSLASIATRDPGTTRSAEISNPLDTLVQRVFVGRERELQQLRSGVDSVFSGRGSVLLLVGEPGIGKTRTSEEIATYASMRGAAVHWGRCYEGEGAPAYWPWVQILREYAYASEAATLLEVVGHGAGAIADVVPELKEKLPGLLPAPALEAEEARFRLFESIHGFLRNASRKTPLLLVLDDLHWADKPSLLLLQFLAREVSNIPVVMLITYRDVELRRTHPLADALAELARIGFGDRVLLRGISEDDVARFGELTTHQPLPPALVRAVFRETEGNPFFVHEVVRLLTAEGVLDRADEPGTESWSLNIPQGIREVIGRRLNALSEACNELLTVASVIGREFDLALLQQVPELGHLDVLDLIDEASAARIVEQMSDRVARYRFSHALVRETLQEELSTTRRVRLHRSVGDLLEQYYGDNLDQHLAELSYHAAEGAVGGGDVEKAIGYATRAAERAARLNAFEEAIPHYRRALQLLEISPRPAAMRRVDLLIELGEAQRQGVDRDQAAATLEEAISLADGVDDERFARAVAELSMARWVLGEPVPELVALLEQALERLADHPGPSRVQVLGCLTQQWMLGDHVDRAREYAVRAVREAEALGDDVERLRAMSMRDISALGAFADLSTREGNIRQLLALARELGDRSVETMALGSLRLVAVQRGDRRLFEQCLDEAEAALQSSQNLSSIGLFLVGRAFSATLDGEWERAEEIAQEAFQKGARANGPASLQMYAIHRGVHIAIEGKEHELLALIEESADAHAQPAWRAALAMSYAVCGRAEEARGVLADFCADNMAALPRDANWDAGAALLCLGADEIGDTAAAAVLYEQYLPLAGRLVNTGITAAVHGSTSVHIGAMCGLLQRWEEGERLFREGIALIDQFGCRHYECDARLSFARFYERRGQPGDTERALELINAALDVAREAVMPGYVNRGLALKLRVQGAAGGISGGSIHALTATLADRDAAPPGVEDGQQMTLMFSDMEGFTQMTERLGDVAAREVVRHHNSIVREQLNTHGGIEVELQGDGFLLAFTDPQRAFDCAVGIQRAFEQHNEVNAEKIRVRIGLHTGEALRDGGKFFGKTVILAARIAAQAQGEEIIISDAVRRAVDADVVDTREMSLKGIADAQTVHTVRWGV